MFYYINEITVYTLQFFQLIHIIHVALPIPINIYTFFFLVVWYITLNVYETVLAFGCFQIVHNYKMLCYE